MSEIRDVDLKKDIDVTLNEQLSHYKKVTETKTQKDCTNLSTYIPNLDVFFNQTKFTVSMTKKNIFDCHSR